MGDLAARYVEEDAGVSVRGTEDLPAAWEAVGVLALIAAPPCGD